LNLITSVAAASDTQSRPFHVGFFLRIARLIRSIESILRAAALDMATAIFFPPINFLFHYAEH
jgi:uncharacterized membrane protein